MKTISTFLLFFILLLILGCGPGDYSPKDDNGESITPPPQPSVRPVPGFLPSDLAHPEWGEGYKKHTNEWAKESGRQAGRFIDESNKSIDQFAKESRNRDWTRAGLRSGGDFVTGVTGDPGLDLDRVLDNLQPSGWDGNADPKEDLKKIWDWLKGED